jgi:GTP-binding protein EngB required for normal cell division
VDIRRDGQELDLQMAQFLRNEGVPFLIVATKADKIGEKEANTSLELLSSCFDLRGLNDLIIMTNVSTPACDDVSFQ